MSARPATTYLGTRSHFRRGQRSGKVSSYRALLSTAIRRKFGGTEAEVRVRGPESDNDGRSASNNNKRVGLVRPKSVSSASVSASTSVSQLRISTNNSSLSEKEKLGRNQKSVKPSPVVTTNKKSVTMTSQSSLTSQVVVAFKTEPLAKESEILVGPDFSSASVPTKLTTTRGLPSPASSTSETSDYQRSTPSPSPRNDQEGSSGSEEAWLPDTGCKNEDPETGLGDEGFSETVTVQGSNRCLQRSLSELTKSSSTPGKVSALKRRSSASKVETSSSSSVLTPSAAAASEADAKVFQQVRISLEKLPTNQLSTLIVGPTTFDADADDDFTVSGKRQKVADPEEQDDGIKKMKLESDASVVKSNLNQCKITDYLPESKIQFNNAIRKQKLDKILNLIKTEPASTNVDPTLPNVATTTSMSSTATTEPSVEPIVKSEATTNISSSTTTTTKTTTTTAVSEVTTVENSSSTVIAALKDLESHSETTPTLATDASVASTSATTKDADAVFEIPQSIRFPLNRNNLEVVVCKWASCGQEFDSNGKLLDHLKTVHAACQGHSSREDTLVKYKCLWEGCKVFGKGSSSKSWLEKHVTNHGGNKPFQCIVDGCHQRFSTQSLLERHVNNHFKSTSSGINGGNSGSGTPGSSGSSSGHHHEREVHVRPFRKYANGRKLKYRRTIYSARIFDLFDIGIMSQVREKLSISAIRCSSWRSAGRLEPSATGSLTDHVVVLSGKVVARRTDEEGEVHVLQRWTPENLINDEWTPLKTMSTTKRIKLSSLQPESRSALMAELFDKKFENLTSKGRKGRKTKPQPRLKAIS